ncbi:hypothetical protein RchiOBHm_Chr6g0244341 [Rosa chinensis]|uniref:Uncharacterized protein n=1 Tax=Rosa chinensis TaxID=74649 RepID=A0A2P6PIZ8_ROSCH|nr:hypothetical protein RchiOBHm_Chr6g0244341 [Rosa chinensis]
MVLTLALRSLPSILYVTFFIHLINFTLLVHFSSTEKKEKKEVFHAICQFPASSNSVYI